MLKKCRSCQSEKLQDLLSLGNQYLADFITGNRKPNQYPLDVVLCGNCFLVQMRNTPPQNELYSENYGYKSGINGTIRADLQDIVLRGCQEVDLQDGDIWLSIGENDGTLLTFVPEYVIKIACEPIRKLAEECEQRADIVINDFWSYRGYAKAVTNKTVSNMSGDNPTKILSHSK